MAPPSALASLPGPRVCLLVTSFKNEEQQQPLMVLSSSPQLLLTGEAETFQTYPLVLVSKFLSVNIEFEE